MRLLTTGGRRIVKASGDVTPQDVYLCVLAFVDDIILVAKSVHEAQAMVNDLNVLSSPCQTRAIDEFSVSPFKAQQGNLVQTLWNVILESLLTACTWPISSEKKGLSLERPYKAL